MSILQAIQTRYPEASQDEFTVRDEGFGPYFSHWIVRNNGQFTPKPTYEEVMGWMQETPDEPDYVSTLASRVAELEGKAIAELTSEQRTVFLEALGHFVGALTAQGLIRPLSAFGQPEEIAPGSDPFGDPDGF